MTNSSYVDGVLDRFIARHEGQYLDHSHAYGPQSPDLIEYYLTELLGRPWQFSAIAAAHLWRDVEQTMKDFERVERGAPLRRGDVLVFDGGDGFGTVGIYERPGSRVGSVCMFTQNPGPAKIVDIMRDGTLNRLLGAWRLTAGAECKIMVDKFAAQLYAEPSGKKPVDRWIAEQQQATKLDVGAPTCPPDDVAAFMASLPKLDPAVTEGAPPAWLKKIGDPSIKPGDVVTFDSGGRQCADMGHVEIITAKTARHYRRQTWIARLKALFRVDSK